MSTSSSETQIRSSKSDIPDPIPDPDTMTNTKQEEEKDKTNSEESETNGEEEEEEEGECGFCLFMKGGGCKDSFVAWEKCIEEAEENKEDIVDKCFEVTAALKKCMEVHSEYYAPILQAEKAAEAELEREKEKEGSEVSSTQVPGHDDPKVLQKD